MSHFAEIDENNIVIRVIVIDQENIDTGNWGPPDTWIQTSYNTRGGVHYAPNSHTPDGGVALRKNYAGIGFTYDSTKDAFIAPKPYPSWTLNEDTCQWDAPVAWPDDDKFYTWDEENRQWEEVTD
tara:strand:+ start:1447 stop:1821 length:375 start_codon:yes stop_codon:yes gene_type:complete